MLPPRLRLTPLGTALLATLALPACATRSVESPPISASASAQYSGAVAEARAYAARLYDSLTLPGLAIAVGVNDQIVMTAEFGYADVEAKAPITPVSQFRIGSVSKLLTAVATARLVQQGKLDLDAPIGRYMPTLPPDKHAITTRQLAGHLGGIRHYGPGEFSNRRHYETVGAALGIFIQDTVLTPPGTRQFYSSYGYNLLAAVDEAASGREFRELVRTEVTRPLGMGHTMVEASLPRGQRPVEFYVKNQGMLALGDTVDLSDRWPSGGFLSTASDLVRFGAGILREPYLSDAMRAVLFTPQKLLNGNATNVGLAWRVASDSAGRRFVHHGGEAMGGRAFLLVYPDQKVVVAMLANQSAAPFREREAGRIARMFLP
jgi:serine beta-lactamase-like protein LACTB